MDREHSNDIYEMKLRTHARSRADCSLYGQRKLRKFINDLDPGFF